MKVNLQKVIRAFLIFSLFAFPLFLLYIALNRFYIIVEHDQEQAELLFAEKRLSQLRLFANGSRFFDQIFKKTFVPAKPDNVETAALKKRIAKLKSRFPRSLEFIVWNKSGKLIKELSDNSDFIFIKKRLNSFLAQLQTIAANSFPETPLLSKSLSREIRSFRGLLGPFVPAAKIVESFSSGDKSSCFQLHGKGSRAYGWYRKTGNFSVLIFISHRAVNSIENLKALCKRMSELEERQNYYLINEKNLGIYPRVSEATATQIRLNLQNCQSITPPELLRNDKMLFSFQKLPGNYWAVATIPRQQLHKVSEAPVGIIVKLLGILGISSFVIYCFFMVHENPFKSIRYKLMALFLYTVAVPLMIFATVASSYINEKEAKIEVDYGYRAFQMLNRFDQQFKAFIGRRSQSLTKEIDQRFWKINLLNNSEGLAKNIFPFIEKDYKPFAMLVMDKQGNNIADRQLSDQISDQSIFKAVSHDLLAYLNRKHNDPMMYTKSITKNSLLSFSRANQRIRAFNLASKTILYYMYAIQNPVSKEFEYCIHLMWDPIELLSEFFDKTDSSLRKYSQHQWALYFAESGEKIGTDITSPAFEMLLTRAKDNGLQLDKLEDNSGNFVLAAAYNGQSLIGSVICVMLDLALIKKEIAAHKNSLGLLLLVIVIFSYSLYNLLNFQILEPIKILSQGVECVKNCKYNKRIDLPSENEFGSLANSINATLENLEELAIAKVVQKELLPEKTPEFSGMEITGKTMPMTSLGGDYYDYYLDAEGNLSVIIADIAGHGIQAALMMAMTKSVLLCGKTEGWKSDELLRNFNQTFCKLRSSGVKTMATAAVVEFTNGPGQFRLLNAGHCAPAIVNKDSVTFLTGASFPLGYRKNRVFTGDSFDFAPGSFLILYTDGIIESSNKHGKMLGPKGFERMILASFANEIDTFLNNLLQAYAGWRQDQDDDISFVLIKRCANV